MRLNLAQREPTYPKYAPNIPSANCQAVENATLLKPRRPVHVTQAGRLMRLNLAQREPT